MSNSAYRCRICKTIIPDETIQGRHYSAYKPLPPKEDMVCSRRCSVKLKAKKGLFKGKHHKNLAESNRENPRRKKKGDPAAR